MHIHELGSTDERVAWNIINTYLNPFQFGGNREEIPCFPISHVLCHKASNKYEVWSSLKSRPLDCAHLHCAFHILMCLHFLLWQTQVEHYMWLLQWIMFSVHVLLNHFENSKVIMWSLLVCSAYWWVDAYFSLVLSVPWEYLYNAALLIFYRYMTMVNISTLSQNWWKGVSCLIVFSDKSISVNGKQVLCCTLSPKQLTTFTVKE